MSKIRAKKSNLTSKDSMLKPFASILQKRMERAQLREYQITDCCLSLSDFANAHLYYGLHKTENGWIFREKAPNARQIFLYGDFTQWQIRKDFALKSIGNGDWEIQLPDYAIKNEMLYKLWMVWDYGADERLPVYSQRVVQDAETKVFTAQVWEFDYKWKNPAPKKPAHPLIYEAHIGMSSQYAKISSYREFQETILPRVKILGYNTLQLMAIQEHPYYGSFGYQVSNFFAPSSRFGTPEELMELIDTAHGLGISVILDIVHSHAVKNEREGIGKFDGSDCLYTLHGDSGYHKAWDSRCFDYGKDETLQFLLSNLKYWIEKFHFDGFRFDGVTSMCYFDHGLGVDFVNYSQYFDNNVNNDALTYLTLANKLVRQINPDCLTIAEDVSGMPGLAYPINDGGIGFDYRMSMGIADFWIKKFKTSSDDSLSPGEIFFKSTDKRNEEQTINYVECHDQALVGDKTLIFRLIDKDMYDKMSVFSESMIVDRGVALHKMIRLVTITCASGGYLNFMGNEFGHPEWIDFPREGNNQSYEYARRQWNLADNKLLKYNGLYNFDADMINIVKTYNILNDSTINVIVSNENDKILAFERADFIFVYNFHHSTSYTKYAIPCKQGNYKIILNTDNTRYCGFGNIDESVTYQSSDFENNRRILLYLPARTAIVLAKID